MPKLISITKLGEDLRSAPLDKRAGTIAFMGAGNYSPSPEMLTAFFFETLRPGAHDASERRDR